MNFIMYYVTMMLLCTSLVLAAASPGDESSTSLMKQSDTLGVQMSTTGGSIAPDPKDDTQLLLTLNGVGEQTLVLGDPTNPSTGRFVDHHVVTEQPSRFAVLLTKNNSGTSGMQLGPADVQFVSLNILYPVAPCTGVGDDGSLAFRVEIKSQDVTNLTGTVGVVSPVSYFRTAFDFPAGMLLWDLTPEGTAGNVGGALSENSLKHLAEHRGLESGPVPRTLEGDTVGAQGVWTTWFLGPFNAWAWICCAYKIPEHLLIGWVSPFSYVTLGLCCI